VQQKNTKIVTSGIQRIVEDGIRTLDGKLHKLDAIICATGFNTSFTPPFDLWGLQEGNLKTMWKNNPAEAYMGLAVSGFPNYWSELFEVLPPKKPN
jgi:cation diffusion facilitator CzcD-associated flavoprotein CzcO